MQPERHSVLGFPVDAVSADAAAAWVLEQALSPGGAPPRLVVTLNPEIVVQAKKSADLAEALAAASLSVADGVGITWAARRLGTPLPGRVPGVELALEVMRRGGGDLRVFFLGAKEGVAQRAAAEAARRYGTVVAGTHHGYFDLRQPAPVLELVGRAHADLLLAGLGEGQELFLHRHAEALGARVMIGVGGTLDVLAGEVRRMPAWTSSLGVEWLFRVLLDRKRWGRIPRLFEFVRLVLRG